MSPNRGGGGGGGGDNNDAHDDCHEGMSYMVVLDSSRDARTGGKIKRIAAHSDPVPFSSQFCPCFFSF